MTFTTLTFLLFLALVFTLYWSLRSRSAQNVLLLLASYGFYSWWDVRFCLLMLVSSLVDYAVGLRLDQTAGRRSRRLLLSISLVTNLGMLGFFKYFHFFMENFQTMAASLGWQVDPVTLRIVLPVGISFYTFQTMSYTFDIYFGRMKASRQLIDYMAYVSFFPQLVAGPIERARRLLPQFLNSRTFDSELAAEGCRLILWGFFKKLVLADRLASYVNVVYGSLDLSSGPQIALATVAFAFQIYCDFSAYSDIARGTARLFGFDLMQNFAYPYFSQSVSEFWRRWHISLSTWFRDYVYIPLGGSRRGRATIIRNILLTFVLSGLWHGASWNFIIWGAIMAFGIFPEMFGARGAPKKTELDVPGGEALRPDRATLRRMALTFTLICCGWVFFRSTTLPDAVLALRKMTLGLFEWEAWVAFFPTLIGKEGRGVLLIVLFLLVVEWLQRRHQHPLKLDRLAQWQRWAVYTVVLWVTLIVGPTRGSEFIYFQF